MNFRVGEYSATEQESGRQDSSSTAVCMLASHMHAALLGAHFNSELQCSFNLSSFCWLVGLFVLKQSFSNQFCGTVCWSQQYCVPPCSGWDCLPALQNSLEGKPVCELNRAGSEPIATPRLVFGDVNFLTHRDALKDTTVLYIPCLYVKMCSVYACNVGHLVCFKI